MAKLSKDDMTKEALVLRFTTQLSQKDERIKKLEKEITIKDREFKELEKEVVVFKTPENIQKKILELKAQGHQYSVILDKMKYSSLDTDINEIRNICLNIDSLNPELLLYYKKQVEAFEESIKINPELLKDTLTKRYEFLYNEASMDLITVTEVEERRKIRVEMKDHLKELNNVLKNIVGNEKDLETNETLSKIAKGLNKSLSSKSNDYEEFSMDDFEVM